MNKIARKKSKNPLYESLREDKKDWNKDVSTLINSLISFKKGINGRGDSVSGEPPTPTNKPFPSSTTDRLNELSSIYKHIVDKGSQIIHEQEEYSRSSHDKLSSIDLDLVSEASWWGSRVRAKSSLPFFGKLNSDNKESKKFKIKLIKFLELTLDMLKVVERKVLHDDGDDKDNVLEIVSIFSMYESQYVSLFMNSFIDYLNKNDYTYEHNEDIAKSLEKQKLLEEKQTQKDLLQKERDSKRSLDVENRSTKTIEKDREKIRNKKRDEIWRRYKDDFLSKQSIDDARNIPKVLSLLLSSNRASKQQIEDLISPDGLNKISELFKTLDENIDYGEVDNIEILKEINYIYVGLRSRLNNFLKLKQKLNLAEIIESIKEQGGTLPLSEVGEPNLELGVGTAKDNEEGLVEELVKDDSPKVQTAKSVSVFEENNYFELIIDRVDSMPNISDNVKDSLRKLLQDLSARIIVYNAAKNAEKTNEQFNYAVISEDINQTYMKARAIADKIFKNTLSFEDKLKQSDGLDSVALLSSISRNQDMVKFASNVFTRWLKSKRLGINSNAEDLMRLEIIGKIKDIRKSIDALLNSLENPDITVTSMSKVFSEFNNDLYTLTDHIALLGENYISSASLLKSKGVEVANIPRNVINKLEKLKQVSQKFNDIEISRK